MKLNNKGFAISGIMYTMLLLFIVLILGVLTMLASRKVILDNAKYKVLDRILYNNLTESTYDENDYIKRDLFVWYDSLINKRMIDNNEINNNVFKDLSGSNNNATLNNFDYNETSGWIDKYLKFDGINDVVMTNLYAATTFPSDSNFTLEMLVKINKVTAIHLNGTNSDTGVLLGAFYYNGYGIGWQTYNNDDSKYNLFVANRTNDMSKGIGQFTNDFENILHLVQIYDSTNNKMLFYINGVKIGETESVTGIYNYASNMGNIGIGKDQIMSGNFRRTYIDMNVYNVKIYKRALLESEVHKNYNIDKIRYLKQG